LEVLPTLWQNAVQTASDYLSFDIKSITEKIYQHLRIHALHDEVLRSFGKLEETGSTDILGHSNPLYLSPLPAVETNTDVYFSCPESPFLFV
jgi:hypothetical protein